MILLNFRCIGSLVAVYFVDFRVGFYFRSEPPLSPVQCTLCTSIQIVQYKNSILAGTLIGRYNC